MRNYEVTFIVDPVLSSEEIKATAQTYHDLIKESGGSIVHVDEMGLRTLAYSINRRNSGVYYSIEFTSETGEFLNDIELAMHRDERVMRFLTVKLDKFGVKYNDDKRNGLIKKAKRPAKKENPRDRDRDRKGRGNRGSQGGKPADAKPKTEAKPAEVKAEPKPAPKEEPKADPKPEAAADPAPAPEVKPEAPKQDEE